MEADLLALLRADGALTALVGEQSHWGWRPREGGLPAVTMIQVVDGRVYGHAGGTGLSGPVIQFDCWAATLLEAKAVADAVTAAIEPGGVSGGTRFVRAFRRRRQDMDPAALSDGGSTQRVSCDFQIWHQPL